MKSTLVINMADTLMLQCDYETLSFAVGGRIWKVIGIMPLRASRLL